MTACPSASPPWDSTYSTQAQRALVAFGEVLRDRSSEAAQHAVLPFGIDASAHAGDRIGVVHVEGIIRAHHQPVRADHVGQSA